MVQNEDTSNRRVLFVNDPYFRRLRLANTKAGATHARLERPHDDVEGTLPTSRRPCPSSIREVGSAERTASAMTPSVVRRLSLLER